MSNLKQLSEVTVRNVFEVLANRIRENNLKIGQADSETLQTAVTIGNDLGEIKTMFAQEGKKSWQKYCKQQCGMTDRTIRNYVRVAEASKQGLLTQCSSLMEAYKVLRKTSPKAMTTKQSAAVVTTGTIQDLKSLGETEPVLWIQAPKATALKLGLQDAWSKYRKQVKEQGHLVIYLQLSKVGKTGKASTASAALALTGISDQVPVSIPA